MTMGGGNFFYFLSQYLLVAAMPLYILEELHGNERDAGLAMTYFQLGDRFMPSVCRKDH